MALQSYKKTSKDLFDNVLILCCIAHLITCMWRPSSTFKGISLHVGWISLHLRCDSRAFAAVRVQNVA